MVDLYLINVYASNGQKVLQRAKSKRPNYMQLRLNQDITKLLTSYFKNGTSNFVICGCDGTINRIINAYMLLGFRIA